MYTCGSVLLYVYEGYSINTCWREHLLVLFIYFLFLVFLVFLEKEKKEIFDLHFIYQCICVPCSFASLAKRKRTTKRKFNKLSENIHWLLALLLLWAVVVGPTLAVGSGQLSFDIV